MWGKPVSSERRTSGSPTASRNTPPSMPTRGGPLGPPPPAPGRFVPGLRLAPPSRVAGRRQPRTSRSCRPPSTRRRSAVDAPTPSCGASRGRKRRTLRRGVPTRSSLAADTFVVQRGEVLTKPRDAAEAREMLARLRDRTHRVLTAVCLIAPRKRPRLEQAVTRVRIRPYGRDQVEAWIARGEPFDKAGAYAIQDPVFLPVQSYGGLLLQRHGFADVGPTLRLLRETGIGRPASGDMPAACSACPLAAPRV